MNTPLYVRPTLRATGTGLIDPHTLVAHWLTELRAAPEAVRNVALTGRIARADSGFLADPGDSLEVARISAALAASSPSDWRERFTRSREDFGDSVPWIDELDTLELVWAAAERAGVAPPGLRAALDGCVDLLVASAPDLLDASEYVQTVAATLRSDLLEGDPILARTAEKFVALMDLAEVAERDAAPLPGLRVPPGQPVQPSPGQPGRVPPLPVGFPLAAGAPVELPAVAPYEWRNGLKGKKGHVAVFQVPRMPPPDRTLKLIVHPAAEYAGKPVLLGGLRGVVGADGVAAFDWDDVVAIGSLVEYLAVGSGAAWQLHQTGAR